MEVIKAGFTIGTLVLLVACSPKKDVSGVFPEKEDTQASTCTADRMSSQFIVQWEDGHISIENEFDADAFSRNFIEPRLLAIKHVEFDKEISVNDTTTYEKSGTALDTPDNWGEMRIGADKALAEGVDGEGVLVAVVDAGITYSHPQINSRLAKNDAEAKGLPGVDDDKNGLIDDIYGWDFFANKPEPEVNSTEDHGTHVAGIILADPNQGAMKGIAPKARLVPVNFMAADGRGSLGAAIQGIQYAVSRGVKVINASWGGPSCSKALSDAVSALSTANVLFVAASGNESTDYDKEPWYYSYPAVYNFPHQITVAATSTSDYMAGFSNRSFNLVHIGAPGVDIISTVNSGYMKMSGTSMAAPFVSGAAALLWSAKPSATAVQIKAALLSSADVITGKELKVSSRGRLNVVKALAEIRRLVP